MFRCGSAALSSLDAHLGAIELFLIFLDTCLDCFLGSSESTCWLQLAMFQFKQAHPSCELGCGPIGNPLGRAGKNIAWKVILVEILSFSYSFLSPLFSIGFSFPFHHQHHAKLS